MELPRRETTFDDVIAASGPLWTDTAVPHASNLLKAAGYGVFGVSGFTINPRRGRTGGRDPCLTTFAVYDRFDCSREVAVFEPGELKRSSDRCQKLAQELADELNRGRDSRRRA